MGRVDGNSRGCGKEKVYNRTGDNVLVHLTTRGYSLVPQYAGIVGRTELAIVGRNPSPTSFSSAITTTTRQPQKSTVKGLRYRWPS